MSIMNYQDDDPGLTLAENRLMRQLDLEEKLFDANDNDRNRLIRSFLSQVELNPLKIEDDFKDLDWINVSRRLSLIDDLSGLIIVCDFFTYCCINCLHILPLLDRIETKYELNEVVVIGVHSPKFENEKSMQNVANAVMKHSIRHPVINDPCAKLWQQMSINCWPTVAILGPNAELLFVLMGETAIQNRLEFYIDHCLKYFIGTNKLCLEKKQQMPIDLSINHLKPHRFKFPTKIGLSPDESMIAIANTLSHTIIVSSVDGNIKHTIGSIVGFKDGTFDQACFDNPQGIAWIDSKQFYVCDTLNNAIRKIDLECRIVTTVCQNNLNSPWDLVYSSSDNRLYISMAGSHQIWTMILSIDGDCVHQDHYPYEHCLNFAGDGKELKRNHRSSLLHASFAQPSGLAVKGRIIYVADSESSSVRTINLETYSVGTLCGGNNNPADLFAFGDIDGASNDCRLQHCIGICSGPNDIVYLADTYNHKIKKINIKTGMCEQIHVNWSEIGNDAARFNEPNGLCYLSKQNRLFVADTNNHRIVSIDLSTNRASIPIFNNAESFQTETLSLDNDKADIKALKLALIESNHCEELELGFKFELKNTELKLNTEAQHHIKLIKRESSPCIIEPEAIRSKKLDDIKFRLKNFQSYENFTLKLDCLINLCQTRQNYCTISRLIVEQPIIFIPYKSGENEKRELKHSISINIEI
ncbi:putative N-acetylgalactosaminyltransferase 9 [Sarcoptes scabiei]|nr:putative N-acetylgalactosaminyltransferase 9 [Sarcoptes scabiei]